MSKEIFFFATRNDILKALKEIELLRKIKYIKCGAYDSKDYLIYDSIDNIGNLSVNMSGNHQSESYLVLDASLPVVVREAKQNTGGIKYFIDQMKNKTSIVFWPGGFYEKHYLIWGHTATILDNKVSQEYIRTLLTMDDLL